MSFDSFQKMAACAQHWKNFQISRVFCPLRKGLSSLRQNRNWWLVRLESRKSYNRHLAVILNYFTVERVFSKHLWIAFVVVFLAEMGRYLAVAGLNLLAQISDRISPYGV